MLIVNVNVALCDIPPPTPVTVTLYDPIGVAAVVVMRQKPAYEGLPADGLIETDALAGTPDTVRFTA